MHARANISMALAFGLALSACAASTPSSRVATAQATGVQLHSGTAGPALDCGYDGSSFNRLDGMQLPKGACAPR